MVESVIDATDNEAWGGRSENPKNAQAAAAEHRMVRELSSAIDNVRYETDEEPRKTEWASTLLLVQEACDAIRASEERVEALEQELDAANARNREDKINMTARLNSAQEEIKAAAARAKAFEARAMEAEGWLARLNQAIVKGLGTSGKRPREF